MREILFKAKRKDNGEWVSGGTIVQFLDDGIRSFYMPQFNEKCDCTHDDATDDILVFENCRFYKVNPDTICQYTGYKNKIGALIWENDVIQYDIYFGIVVFNEGAFEIKWIDDSCNLREEIYFWATERNIAVVGNKFDNPELLEELVE